MTGWVCPKCGRVFAPDVKECCYCNDVIKDKEKYDPAPEPIPIPAGPYIPYVPYIPSPTVPYVTWSDDNTSHYSYVGFYTGSDRNGIYIAL